MSDHKLNEFLIDPGCDQFSLSRLGLGLMNLMAVIATIWMLHLGKDPTTLIVGVAGVDGGAYAASKFGRWCKDMLPKVVE